MITPNWATMHVIFRLETRAHFVDLESSTRITVDEKWKIAISKSEKPHKIHTNPEWRFRVPADFAELDFIVCVTANSDCFVIPTGEIYLDAFYVSLTWPIQRNGKSFSRFHEEWRIISDVPGLSVV